MLLYRIKVFSTVYDKSLNYCFYMYFHSIWSNFASQLCCNIFPFVYFGEYLSSVNREACCLEMLLFYDILEAASCYVKRFNYYRLGLCVKPVSVYVICIFQVVPPDVRFQSFSIELVYHLLIDDDTVTRVLRIGLTVVSLFNLILILVLIDQLD